MQAANMVLEATEWVQKTHPKIWQRRGGRDHIYLIPNDEGASERSSAWPTSHSSSTLLQSDCWMLQDSFLSWTGRAPAPRLACPLHP